VGFFLFKRILFFSYPPRSAHMPPALSDYPVSSVRIFTALQFILSKIGAVIAQLERQFDENVGL
jgi:small basic protein